MTAREMESLWVVSVDRKAFVYWMGELDPRLAIRWTDQEAAKRFCDRWKHAFPQMRPVNLCDAVMGWDVSRYLKNTVAQ